MYLSCIAILCNQCIREILYILCGYPDSMRGVIIYTRSHDMSKTMGKKCIALNKKARMLYEISTTYEAGIVLSGSEVKSIRNGKVNFVDSFVDITEEAYIIGLHIAPYEHAGYVSCEPTRQRKLLLHRKEINTLSRQIATKGITVVPLAVYFKKGIIKIEIAVGKGRKLYDHRHVLKEKAQKREMDREMKYK